MSEFLGWCSRRGMLLGVAAAGLGPALPALAQTIEPVGRVAAVRGPAFLARRGQRLPADSGGDLFLEDLATTGEPSRLDLLLGAATRIRLGSNAAFRIDRFAAGLAAATELRKGPVLVEHGEGAEPDFTLRSPFALIAARGTVFFAGPSKGVFGVLVREGEVEVRNQGGSVRLTSGQGTDIRARGAPPTPPKIWAPPRVQAALASVT